ncbi:MAG TPA: S41 family peptidase [Thermoanaerobaculia bacterium]|nr:S41 family peptidase [Thermoanaerobaculia bacterium]
MIAVALICTAGVVASLERALREHYVFAETGERMAAALEANRAAYSGISGNELASALTRDINAIAHDKHLRVAVASPKTPAAQHSVADPDHGFRTVEVLPDNIGYLELTKFERPDAAVTEKAAAAFARLKDVDALIIDLRANGGGNPAMVALVSAYVLDRPTLLAEMHHRESEAEPIWSAPRPANALRHGVPLFLLTSHDTFSAGEGFAFLLQHLGRAKVVGDQTAGAAHAGRAYSLPCGFEADIPNTSVVLPGTHADWEGRGVIPDVAVPAARALEVARALASRPAG